MVTLEWKQNARRTKHLGQQVVWTIHSIFERFARLVVHSGTARKHVAYALDADVLSDLPGDLTKHRSLFG